MLKGIAIALVGCIALSACEAPAVGPPAAPVIPTADITSAQTTVASATAKINAVCGPVSAATSLAAPFSAVPAVGALISFGSASCGSAEAIAALVGKAVNDPTTIAWAENLAGQITTAVSAAKAEVAKL